MKKETSGQIPHPVAEKVAQLTAINRNMFQLLERRNTDQDENITNLYEQKNSLIADLILERRNPNLVPGVIQVSLFSYPHQVHHPYMKNRVDLGIKPPDEDKTEWVISSINWLAERPPFTSSLDVLKAIGTPDEKRTPDVQTIVKQTFHEIFRVQKAMSEALSAGESEDVEYLKTVKAELAERILTYRAHPDVRLHSLQVNMVRDRFDSSRNIQFCLLDKSGSNSAEFQIGLLYGVTRKMRDNLEQLIAMGGGYDHFDFK